MTLNEMISTYKRASAAHAYMFGFVQNGKLYTVKSNALIENACKLDRASSAKGGYAKVRINFTAKLKAMLIATGKAICEGSAELMEYADKYNKGEHYEHYITERYTKETWTKDSVPFTVAGDIELNGVQIQIKFDGAELTNERTLARLTAKA